MVVIFRLPASPQSTSPLLLYKTCSRSLLPSSFCLPQLPQLLLHLTTSRITMLDLASSQSGAIRLSLIPPTAECKPLLDRLRCALSDLESTSNYVDQGTAQSLNLSFASSNSFVMRADASTTLNPNGPGRNSVRLQSNKQYGANTVVM